ncbi:hypothetical protein [Flavobacterium sp. KMS]|uniref:hypothetical protein n=1 Tax=unclassified Flavobacterium TaxID=196869 RepID=UPI000B10D704|nr:hypothetical protein [Flavobacterium sp. KMS]
MKKLYFLFLIILSFKSYGQTYTIKVSYDASSAGCHAAGFRWDLKGDSSTIDSFSDGGNSMDVDDIKIYPNVANFTTFKLSSGSNCRPLDSSPNCTSTNSKSSTNVKMIQGDYLGFGACNGGVSITLFKPNVTIQNLDTANSNEICAGFQLGLSGYPTNGTGKFPDEAYHWQYSLDNVSWTDVLASKNNNAIAKFSIEEILSANGINHINYLDKLIYFRLGYGQDRPFTTPLAIKYSACAPILKNVTYSPPECNNDYIKKIEVFFDRDLKYNETLYPFYIININPLKNSPHFQLVEPLKSLTKDAETGFYKYTFLSPGILEEKETYRIEYQANRNESPAGSLQSPQNFNFTYTNPTKMQFEITNYTEPSCKGGSDGVIEIKVLSGTSPYYFYKDGVEITPAPTLQNGKYFITGLGAKTYNIMVTDTKGCIEKI